MPYIFGKLWHLAIIWAIRKEFQCILQGVRILLAKYTRISPTSENDSYHNMAHISKYFWMLSLLGILKRYIWDDHRYQFWIFVGHVYYNVQIWCQFLCDRKEVWESCTHQLCFEAQLLFIVSLLIASRCLIAEQPLSAPVRLAEYLLSVFVRLESVWLLAEGLLIVGTFHCYSSFAKLVLLENVVDYKYPF